MPIRQFKPVTAGTRGRSVSDFSEITRATPERSLTEPLKKSGGRNVVSPWGKKEGVKTRNKKKSSQRLIVRGRKRGKATQ